MVKPYKIPCRNRITYGEDVKVETNCDANVCGNLKVKKNLTVKKDLIVNGQLTIPHAPAFQGDILTNIEVPVVLDATARSTYYIYLATPAALSITFSSDIPAGTTIEFILWKKDYDAAVSWVRDPVTSFEASIVVQGGSVSAFSPGSILSLDAFNSTVGDRVKVTYAGLIMEANAIAVDGAAFSIA